MQAHIKDLLDSFLNSHNINDCDYVIERPKNPTFGHFSSNIAMKLARVLRKRPLDIAQDIVDFMGPATSPLKEISIAAPGFINFTMEK